MSGVPPQLYGVALVMLMDQQGVGHFEFDMSTMDAEQWRGLSVNCTIDGGKVTVANGRCECPKCAASVGGRTQ